MSFNSVLLLYNWSWFFTSYFRLIISLQLQRLCLHKSLHTRPIWCSAVDGCKRGDTNRRGTTSCRSPWRNCRRPILSSLHSRGWWYHWPSSWKVSVVPPKIVLKLVGFIVTTLSTCTEYVAAVIAPWFISTTSSAIPTYASALGPIVFRKLALGINMNFKPIWITSVNTVDESWDRLFDRIPTNDKRHYSGCCRQGSSCDLFPQKNRRRETGSYVVMIQLVSKYWPANILAPGVGSVIGLKDSSQSATASCIKPNSSNT